MLPKVKVKSQGLQIYQKLISPQLFQEIKELAKELRSLKVVMINSTSKGGGVAEILKSLIPLMKGLGIEASWYLILPNKRFFHLTKKIHNSLQGKDFYFSYSLRRFYFRHLEKSAKLMLKMKADLWVFHDPQPAGIVGYLSPKDFSPSILRIHIDTTKPSSEIWNFFKGFLLQYNKIIFSSPEFVHSGIPKEKIVIIPPAIDPFSEKNKEINQKEVKVILKKFGLNKQSPLLVQVSRFDPWKDPLGAIKAYRKAKEKIPNLQFAFLGLFLAVDDPEAEKIFKETKKEADKDKDIFLFSDPAKLDNLGVDRFVNAFQKGADVILQKSIREGFGLSVTEAMWKEKAVVAGNVGGIKLQIKDGKNGFLVSSPGEAGERIVKLLKDEKLREKLGRAAKETVREKFLMPRLLRDYLKLFRQLLKE
jgi:trehalose synthase